MGMFWRACFSLIAFTAFAAARADQGRVIATMDELRFQPTEEKGRAELVELLSARPELRGLGPQDIVQVAADMDRTYREQQVLGATDRLSIDRLHKAAAAAGVPLRAVPMFEQDIYGVEGLALVSQHLVT